MQRASARAWERPQGRRRVGRLVVELDAGERFHFLYEGEAAADGELPVLCADTSDSGSVGLAAPGFDVYLAQRFGVIVRKAFAGSCPAGMQASWKAQVKANLGARAIIEALEYMDDDIDADELTPGSVCRAYAYHRKMGMVAARAALGDALGGLFESIQRENKAKAPDGARLTLDGGQLSVGG